MKLDWDAATRRRKAAESRRRYYGSIEEPTIAAGGCWCGKEFGHSWEGRNEGAPHPR